MHKKVAWGLLRGLLMLLLAIWAGANAVLSQVGNAQTVLSISDPTTLQAKALLWVFATPWWIPAGLAALMGIALIVARLREDMTYAGQMDSLKSQVADLAARVLHGSAAGPNTKADALRIKMDKSAKYFHQEHLDSGVVTQFVRVGVENVGDGWLMACVLRVKSITPLPNRESPVNTLSEAFDLDARMERVFSVGGYNLIPSTEKTANYLDYDNYVTVWFPAPGTWNGGAAALLEPSKVHTIRLRATADGCNPYETELRVWVDHARRLNAELLLNA